MNSQIIMLLITFALSVIIALITIPILKKLKVGQIERTDGPQSHLSKQGTPTMGGVIMLLAILIGSIIACLFFLNGEKSGQNMIPLLVFGLGIGLIGFIDDFKKLVLKNTEGLKPKFKMLGLLVISVLFVVYLVKFTDVGTGMIIPFVNTEIELPIWFYIPFSILVILATTNAVNLTDGVDGLGGSVATIIIATLAVLGIKSNLPEVSVFGGIVCGAILGFLIFNIHPAKVFMGDTGSLMLGGIVAGMSIYLKLPLLLILIAIIPICETLSVIIQVAYYKKTKKRIFKMAPIHHHFELSGWSENRVVSVFSLITAIVCIIGVFAI